MHVWAARGASMHVEASRAFYDLLEGRAEWLWVTCRGTALKTLENCSSSITGNSTEYGMLPQFGRAIISR